MKNNAMRFLKVSLALVVLLCVVIFSFLAYYMNIQSSATISEIGTIYMSGLTPWPVLWGRTPWSGASWGWPCAPGTGVSRPLWGKISR